MSPFQIWIKNHLFTVTGRLNNRACIESWWTKRNFTTEFQQLQDLTVFMSEKSIAEKLHWVYNDLTESPKCHCGKPTNFINFGEGYYTYCSKYCSTQGVERNRKISENTDREKVQEKVRQTNLKKYGVEYYFQTRESVDKIKATKLRVYGDENYCNMEKIVETNLKKYGVKYTTQNPDTIQKIQENKIVKTPPLRDKEWLINENKTKGITQIAEELGVTYRSVYLWFKKFDIEIKFFSPDYSKEQKEILEFINSEISTDIDYNTKNIITPKELDIYLPKFNLAIEYNGMYWHSGDKTRHQEKLKLCIDKNIKLLQFWDIEWKTNKDIVKSIIKSNLGLNEKIYARKCIIRPLDNTTYFDFLENNHIQGKVSSIIKYGLFYQDELVSVIGFGKSRFDKKHTHELLRYCNKINISVVGGFSKLLKYSRENNDLNSIVSYCDLRLFDGKMYEKAGFIFSHQTTPGYVYYKSGIVRNRQYFQKHKLADLFTNFDPELTEAENLAMNKWLQVWDCGQKVFSI